MQGRGGAGVNGEDGTNCMCIGELYDSRAIVLGGRYTSISRSIFNEAFIETKLHHIFDAQYLYLPKIRTFTYLTRTATFRVLAEFRFVLIVGTKP